jgi:PAS domain S-box-containing protein
VRAKAPNDASAVSFIGPLLRGRAAWLRYPAAILVVAATTGIRVGLVRLIGTESPLLALLPAIFLIAYLGGLGPALLGCALSTACATALFTHWPHGDAVPAWSAHTVLFAAIGVLISLIMHRMQIELVRRRGTEEALEESARQLRLVTDNLPVLISYVDQERCYRFTNAQWTEWLGAEQAPTFGRQMRDVLGEDVYLSRERYIAAALSGERVRFEGPMWHRTLGLRDCEISYVPDAADTGQVRGFYVMAQDITERKRAETALRDREAMLQLIYDHSSDCLYLVEIGAAGDEFRFVSVNETFLKISGFAREQVEGMALGRVKPAASEQLARAKYAEVIATRKALVYSEEVDLPAGHRCGEVTLIPILDTAGVVTHILGNINDVTERKRAEEALREADRRKDEFLAMLAHELRNPLAPIRTIAHVLARGDATDPAAVRRHGELLKRQASQLARLLDDLLDVARITRGTIELRKEILPLASIVEHAIEAVQPLLTLKRQNVSVSPAVPELFVEADEVRLTQLFSNLLKNASKYSGERMIIEITIEREGDYARVRVRDRGVGIDPELLPHIFDLFMQADRTLDRTDGGLGVGLTVARHLVELHGGTITAHSSGLQHGSEFVVRLPLAAPPASIAAYLPQAGRQPGRRILVVDDNRDSAEALALLLATDGHEVEVAHDGPAALSTLQRFHAEVAIVDIGLPGMDGYVLAQCIRERIGDKAPLLYALTGYGREEDRALAAGAGFDRHMTKPVDPQVLLALLTREESAPDQQTLEF